MTPEIARGSDPVRRGAEEVLDKCLAILETRGKQHKNTTLEDDGALTGRPPLDILIALVEVKVSRLHGQLENFKQEVLDRLTDRLSAAPPVDVEAVLADEESENTMAKFLQNPTTEDTIIDLINYLALMLGRVWVVNARCDSAWNVEKIGGVGLIKATAGGGLEVSGGLKIGGTVEFGGASDTTVGPPEQSVTASAEDKTYEGSASK